MHPILCRPPWILSAGILERICASCSSTSQRQRLGYNLESFRGLGLTLVVLFWSLFRVHSYHLLCKAHRRISSRAPPESCTSIHKPSPLEMSEDRDRQGDSKSRSTLKNSSTAGHSPRSTRFSFLLAIASFAEPIEIPRVREIFFSRGTASEKRV